MVIFSIDKEATMRNLVRKKRKLDDKIRTESSSQCLKQVDLTLADLELDSQVDIPSEDDKILDNPDFEVPLKKATKKYNTNSYPCLSLMCDRFLVSNNCAAALVNSALKDLNLLNYTNTLGGEKIRYERMRSRQTKIRELERNMKGINYLSFDGKIDSTLMKESESSSTCLTPEEHFVLVSQPANKYIDHVSPNSGKAEDISDEIISVLQQIDSISTLLVIACDGTPVNTGCSGGVIRKIEEKLERPLQWVICMFHSNELPLRHLISVLDGKTTGPHTSSGNN